MGKDWVKGVFVWAQRVGIRAKEKAKTRGKSSGIADSGYGRETYVDAQSRLIVLQLELEVVSLHDGLHQAHAEAIAWGGAALFEPVKTLEDLIVLRCGDAGTTVT